MKPVKNPHLGRKSDAYKSIMQFFNNKSEANFQLGIQLLQSTMDAKILIQVLSARIYPSGKICYAMVPFFQQHKKLWKSIRTHLPYHIHSEIDQWMPFELLDFKGQTLEAFCTLANEQARNFDANFPLLSKDILCNYKGYGYASTDNGSSIQDGIGWTLQTDGHMYGPAEIFETDTWTAIAHHPDFSIKISHLEDSGQPDKTWMEVLK